MPHPALGSTVPHEHQARHKRRNSARIYFSYFTKVERSFLVQRASSNAEGASMKSDHVGGASTSTGSLSRQNDDSSVVSLKALVAKAETKSSPTRSSSFDDSGLIDLKKLMAQAPPSSDALPPVLAPSEAGLFDVPKAPLPASVATPSLPPSSKENHTSSRAAWIAAAAAVMATLVSGAFMLHRALEPDAAQVRSGMPAAAPTAANEATKPVDVVAPTATTPAVARTESTETPAKPAETASSPGRRAALQSPSRERTRQEASSTKNPAPDKPAPAAACDLMCQMQRAANGPKKK